MSREVAGSSPAAPIKFYVVGRADLPPGLRVAQMFHAARQFAKDHPEEEREWFEKSNTIVLLEVLNEQGLEELAERAEQDGISFSTFKEPDMGISGFTAIALGSDARRIVSSLPLALK